MRLSRNKKVVAPPDRREELRRGRTAAATLRTACPEAASVRVELEFRSATGEAHVPQAFALFPPAKAYFVYPCPYGDCDGLYDLQAVALQALQGKQKRSRGTLKCAGSRSRDKTVGRPCELQMTYSITLTMDRGTPAERPRAAVAGSMAPDG